MEFKEVVGRRRSIRYFLPWRPVPREKIQIILEAARLASRAGNKGLLRNCKPPRCVRTPPPSPGAEKRCERSVAC